MTEQIPDVNIYRPEPIAVPAVRPSPHSELLRDADHAVAFLNRLSNGKQLDPELRIAMNDVMHTVKALKQTLGRMDAEAQNNHDKMVEIIRSQNKRLG